MYAIYNENNFVYSKTFKKNSNPKIPTLDILFKRLLTINPENRMTYKEFFDYVFSDDFMKEGVICVNNNRIYRKIFNDILNEKFIDLDNNYIFEGESLFDYNEKKINNLVKEGIFPDIMNFPNVDDDKKYNNIIYYDVNVNYLNSIDQDSYHFEKVVNGAFILCTNINSFKLIREEILSEIRKDKRIIFNLITTGSQCDNIMKLMKI